ncbi:MAG: hypothetical protein E7354_00920 [Clostridiales bacterium]|nr:hypothetical protein [Clostridiales bacterium]
MIESIVKNELKKNLVKDNYSNKCDKVVFKNHVGISELKLKVSANGSYGYLYVEVFNTQDFSVSINGIECVCFNSGSSGLYPIRFKYGDVLTLNGNCDRLMLYVIGAEFDVIVKDKFLLISNKYIECCGGCKRIYSCDEVNFNDYVFEYEEDLVDIFEIEFNNSIYLVKIKNDDGVYLCIDKDNYTKQIMLNFDYDDMIITSSMGDGLLEIVYLYRGKVYKCALSDEFILGEPVAIENIVDIVSSLSAVSSDLGYSAFVCKMANGNNVIYVGDNGMYTELFSTKSKICDFCIIGNFLYCVYQDAYDFVIKKYNFSLGNHSVKLVQCKKIEYADSVKIYGDYVLVKYNFSQRVIDIGDL